MRSHKRDQAAVSVIVPKGGIRGNDGAQAGGLMGRESIASAVSCAIARCRAMLCASVRKNGCRLGGLRFSRRITATLHDSMCGVSFGSSDFLVKQGARWYPGRGQNWLVRRMQRSSLLNYRNRCQNLVGARRKHTRPHPHQAEPDQVPALQSAAYAAE